MVARNTSKDEVNALIMRDAANGPLERRAGLLTICRWCLIDFNHTSEASIFDFDPTKVMDGNCHKFPSSVRQRAGLLARCSTPPRQMMAAVSGSIGRLQQVALSVSAPQFSALPGAP